jgi:pimeloyl-ACP methyl ester carboxylesterase
VPWRLSREAVQVAVRSGAVALNLEVEELGTADRGSIVLVMGLGAQLIAWPVEFCRALAAAGYRVIRFDNRDVGLSTKFSSAGVPNARAAIWRRLLRLPARAPYTLSDMAADTVGLMDALRIADAHIVGASLGGMISQIVAAQHPKRVRSLTCIMSSPGVPWPWESSGDARTLLSAAPIAIDDIEGQIQSRVRTYKILGGASQPYPEEALYEFARYTVARSADTDGRRRQFVAGHASGDLRPLLRDIGVPTLLIHGRNDPLIPVARSEQLHRGIRDSKLMIVEDMGHNLPPAALPRMLDAILENCGRNP